MIRIDRDDVEHALGAKFEVNEECWSLSFCSHGIETNLSLFYEAEVVWVRSGTGGGKLLTEFSFRCDLIEVLDCRGKPHSCKSWAHMIHCYFTNGTFEASSEGHRFQFYCYTSGEIGYWGNIGSTDPDKVAELCKNSVS